MDIGQRSSDIKRVAVAIHGGIPHLLERDAHGHFPPERPDIVDHHYTKRYSDRRAHVIVCLEDTNIQHQDGDLGETEAKVVKEGGNISYLHRHIIVSNHSNGVGRVEATVSVVKKLELT